MDFDSCIESIDALSMAETKHANGGPRPARGLIKRAARARVLLLERWTFAEESNEFVSGREGDA